MNPQYINLYHLKPADLDMALAAGWFRIQQTLFTTDVLSFEDMVYKTIWLRVALDNLEPDKTHKKLIKKNKLFRTEITRLHLTPEHETLFAKYKNDIPFEASSTLHSLLFGNEEKNVFNTWIINLYDENLLIATGGFDLGEKSVEGIFSVYDPAYKKYSPGKYLIYEKMHFCKKEGFTWFYPGYYVPGYSRFDYKKEIGKEALEYFDREKGNWFQL